MIALVESARGTYDLRTLLGEQFGNCLADATACAGDDGDLAVENAHLLPPILQQPACDHHAVHFRRALIDTHGPHLLGHQL